MWVVFHVKSGWKPQDLGSPQTLGLLGLVRSLPPQMEKSLRVMLGIIETPACHVYGASSTLSLIQESSCLLELLSKTII